VPKWIALARCTLRRAKWLATGSTVPVDVRVLRNESPSLLCCNFVWAV
jgi:hypothetical protein